MNPKRVYIKPMSQLSLHKFGDNLPVTSIVAFSQAAIGFGVGILLAKHLGRNTKKGVAIGVIATGVAALSPLVAGIVANVKNRPTSSSRMRKQLDGIRRGAGVSENGHPF